MVKNGNCKEGEIMDEQLATIKKPGEIEKISDAEFQRRVIEIAKCKQPSFRRLRKN